MGIGDLSVLTLFLSTTCGHTRKWQWLSSRQEAGFHQEADDAKHPDLGLPAPEL